MTIIVHRCAKSCADTDAFPYDVQSVPECTTLISLHATSSNYQVCKPNGTNVTDENKPAVSFLE